MTELFEARKPKDPAIIAEIDGEVELVAEKKRGKRIIVVRGDDKTEVEHVIPHGKQLLVHANDRVRAGDALVRGPLVPHDILRVSGAEAVQQYLLHEIQNVYRSQRVEIDDKHIEIVIAQMLRKLKIEDVGDSTMLPGIVIDKFEFRRTNEQLMECGKITEPGDTEFQIGDIVPLATLEEVNAQVEAAGQKPAKSTQAATRDRQHSASGNHQGGRAERKLHLGSQLPGDDQGAHRSGSCQQGRQPRRPQGKRHPGALDPGGNGLPHPPGGRGPHPARALQELRAEKERISAARLALLTESTEPPQSTSPASGS